jgi:hypothetical protein
VVGVVFLAVGLVGFIPGVAALHDVVRLLFGIAGITLARSQTAARVYLVGGGVGYLVLFVHGLLVDAGSSLNVVPVSTSDNWLHLGVALVMVLLGVVLGRNLPAAHGSV